MSIHQICVLVFYVQLEGEADQNDIIFWYGTGLVFVLEQGALELGRAKQLQLLECILQLLMSQADLTTRYCVETIGHYNDPKRSQDLLIGGKTRVELEIVKHVYL